MKNTFVLFLIIISLTGCIPTSDHTNGYYQYIEGEGLDGYSNFYRSMLFLTEDIGLLAGNVYTSIPNRKVVDPLYSKTEAVWWRTENQGHIWQRHLLVEGGEFKLLKQNNDWVYGIVSFGMSDKDSCVIFQSNDLGNSWHVKSSVPINITDFHFRDSLHGILHGRKGVGAYTFFKTNNGGKSWQEYPYSSWLKSPRQMNDSMIYCIIQNDSSYYSSNSYLLGWNYLTDKQVFKIPIPHKSVCTYTDSILVIKDDKDVLSLYKLTPQDTLKFLYTFRQPVWFVDYIAKDDNKIYIKFSYDLTDYLFFSKDGGKTWLKRKYFMPIYGPQCVLKSKDTLRLWILSYGNYINTFKN